MRFFIACLFMCCAAFAGGSRGAEASEQTDHLLDLTGLDRSIELMRIEGLAHADELARDMLPDGPSESYRTAIVKLYQLEQMRADVRAGFAAQMDQVDLDPLLTYFESETGQRIIGLELSTREAMIESDIEEAAKLRAQQFERAEDDIFLGVLAHIEAGDLITANVVGSLNSNIQFYHGLVAGGAISMSEAEIVADVWSQEDELRRDAREWLLGFLTMAYHPLAPGELDSYTELASTPEGQALTRALFAGYAKMYDRLSFGLGLAIAEAMTSEET